MLLGTLRESKGGAAGSAGAAARLGLKRTKLQSKRLGSSARCYERLSEPLALTF
jgi:hypothetical protein